MESPGSDITSLWNSSRNVDQSPDDIPNLPLKNFHWRYRGEGNANLVIALPKEKVILRMPKCDYNTILDSTTIREWEVKLKKSVAFYKKVMVPLLGTEFILPPDLARLSEIDVCDVDRILMKRRPCFRLSKGIRLSLVTIQPDYTLLPPRKSYKALFDAHNITSNLSRNGGSDDLGTFCVEIKPKQGWIPLADRHRPNCTFCLKQYWKLQKKRATKRSDYCPLDLFSGDKRRMCSALESLLETPQNNLKIFYNGDILYGEDTNNELNKILNAFFGIKNSTNSHNVRERWCHLILNALTREFDNTNGGELNGTNFSSEDDNKIEEEHNLSIDSSPSNRQQHNQIKEPCDWSYTPLPRKCILQRVLAVQKLQTTSFKNVYSSYKEQSELRGNYSYVDDLFSVDNSLNEVQRYLLSATAKDCSIFVAIQKIGGAADENSPFYIKDNQGVTYRLNIGISDIDPKPLSCIGKHFNRDKELLAAALQSNR